MSTTARLAAGGRPHPLGEGHHGAEGATGNVTRGARASPRNRGVAAHSLRDAEPLAILSPDGARLSQGRIIALARDLEARGVQVDGLSGLQEELDVIEAPPSLFGRLTQGVRKMASRQWRHVLGELQESQEVLGLLTRRVRDNEPLTPEQTDAVRDQLLDLLRVVPAGLIAFANSALPVPGTGLLTPWLLARLGLMPSRWREAHLLARLDNEAQRLRALGQDDAAERVEALEHELEEEADAREAAAHAAALLTHWDANGNGTWDPDEQAGYDEAADRLRGLARERAHQRRWFLSWNHQVFGPTRLTDVAGVQDSVSLLVCFDGHSGWVSLTDVLPVQPPSPSPAPASIADPDLPPR